MTTSSHHASTPSLPTQKPGPDGCIAPIRRHNNKHAIPGQLWWMLYFLGRVDRKRVFDELVTAIQEYGERRGVFLGPDGARNECGMCGAILTSENVSQRLLKRGVYIHDACIQAMDRERAEFIARLELEMAESSGDAQQTEPPATSADESNPDEQDALWTASA